MWYLGGGLPTYLIGQTRLVLEQAVVPHLWNRPLIAEPPPKNLQSSRLSAP